MIYPQSIKGKFRTIKNIISLLLLIVYFFSSFIRWPRFQGQPTQAFYIDLKEGMVYFFNIEIWPQDLYLLTMVLIILAATLFLVTNLYGRVWCGYICPHTVFVDIFVAIEALFQGDRNSRIKLDSQSMDTKKFTVKMLTHLSWIFMSFLLAFSTVSYFYDSLDLIKDLSNFKVSYKASISLAILTLSTYFFAGFMRNRVCLYICPYGRFQSAMIDNNTTLVTYRTLRGEPRGKPDTNHGDCIDCGKCVFVCPAGIDIRDGLQIGCINCGLCVDACNSVMLKLGRLPDLIGYDSLNSTNSEQILQGFKKNWFLKKSFIYLTMLIITISLLIYCIITKNDLTFSVMHNRNAIAIQLPDGSIRNDYTFKISNKINTSKRYILSALSDINPVFKLQGFDQTYSDHHNLELGPNEEMEMIMFVKIDKTLLKTTSNNITFELKDQQSGKLYRLNSIFINRD